MNSIETRLRDAKLGSAIENAAGNLPKYFEIEISIESGSAIVSLCDPKGEIHSDFYDGEELSDNINNAVQHAIECAEGNR